MSPRSAAQDAWNAVMSRSIASDVVRARRQQQPSRSWWIGLSRSAFTAQVQQEQPRMAVSKIGSSLSRGYDFGPEDR